MKTSSNLNGCCKKRKNCIIICHNRYRLIIKFRYDKHLALVLFIGTHKEYDKIDIDKL
ncbi:MAG: hypothetical protein COB98_06025 [Flavobacteriaceae bacterium]|nr:MAG: hypothetical protein COB98_06025 [Flavobacteriaceae bacterium]